MFLGEIELARFDKKMYELSMAYENAEGWESVEAQHKFLKAALGSNKDTKAYMKERLGTDNLDTMDLIKLTELFVEVNGVYKDRFEEIKNEAQRAKIEQVKEAAESLKPVLDVYNAAKRAPKNRQGAFKSIK